MARFEQHGRSLGVAHRAGRAPFGQATFYPRLQGNIRALRTAHRAIAEEAREGQAISAAAEWLLDNFHLIESQLREIRSGLPGRYYHSLPVLQDAPLRGLPRIYGVAWAFVAHTDSAFDEALLQHFLDAYQDERELSLGELWALPTTLRVVLVENLRRLADRIASRQMAQQAAAGCAKRVDALALPALATLHARMVRRGVGAVFLAHLAQDLAGHVPPDGEAALTPVRQWLAAEIPDLAALQTQQHAAEAADHLSVGNAVMALRLIGAADWPGLVAGTSRVIRVMLNSPVFAAEDDATRNTTLHGIERLSAQSGQGEAAVAQALLGLMHGATDHAALAGHWLQGAGRPALEQVLGQRQRQRVAGWWRLAVPSLRVPLYLGALLAGTLLLVAWLLAPSGWSEASGMLRAGMVLTVVLMLLPASEAVVALLNRLIGESLKPTHLPRLRLADGIPRAARTMVVMPLLLGHPQGIAQAVHRLGLHYLANEEVCAQFALLSDWADADTAHRPEDEALLSHARQLLAALNVRYPVAPGQPPRFLLLHRPRVPSATQRQWIGWERKRGKLEQLVAALATGDARAFLDLGPLSQMAAGTRYLLTLDSDTQLPPGRLRVLVGIAEHPANQPRLDAAGRRVVHGYGIVQPRVTPPLLQDGAETAWQWLFDGQRGIDPYSAMSSDVYQDLFGEGSFTGKGLLHVATLHTVLGARLPVGQVLSHDLLEGALVRCAVATDVTLIEAEPGHADAAAARLHRWVRGDWQLLPFLLQRRRWPLGAINRYKLFDNLRRSLVAPASLGLIVLAMAGLGVSLAAALALTVAAVAAGPLMGAMAGAVPRHWNRLGPRLLHAMALDVLRAIAGGLWHLALLVQHALLATDALVRTLWRLLVSRRQLLEWTTAEAAHADLRPGLAATWRRHRTEPVAVLLLAGLWWWMLPVGAPAVAALALLALWAMAPLLVWVANAPWPRQAALPEADRALLHETARDTWRFFEHCVDADNHHLPPDNLQTLPFETLAHRTSPTNIGLYLLSVACARQFGWIGTPDLLARLEATLATLERLERHRGHFLNWYDTRTLQPLPPRYISTVDSGNLSTHLLAVGQACTELAREPQNMEHLPRLQAMAEALEALAWQPQFRFLYHPRRHLLHIGYRVDEQQLDTAFYDLLASESRSTSLLAIAKGELPVRHWAALGRPFFASGRLAVLRSWSGSMFEYLMPTLVLAQPRGSALDEAGHAALREQRAFVRGHGGRKLGMPWGISESAYAGRDHSLAYQYAPQGVPSLALRRTPPDERVIAPYATALAAQVDARAACRNLRALEGLGARGRYGFFEAIDFTPSRQTQGGQHTLVGTCMAHHQGMVIVALANVLHAGVAQRWGMAHPRIEAVLSLLHERAPSELRPLPAPAQPLAPHRPRQVPESIRTLVPGAQAPEPTQLLSNGRYSLTLRPNGAGWSRWGTLGITRWRDDALRDAHGSFVYLRLAPAGPLASLTRHPAPDPLAVYQCRFHIDRVCFEASWPGLRTRTTVWVSPEDDIELRKTVLLNQGRQTIELELVSALDVTLASPAADEAHPAFSSLFVQADWLPDLQALRFVRKPRLPGEPALQMAHFVAGVEGEMLGLSCQTDRQQWLGRNHAASQPMAMLQPVPGAASTLATGLDPVAVLGVRLRLAPGAQACVTFATAASDDGATLLAVVDKYRQPSYVERASVMSATLAGIQSVPHGLRAQEWPALQVLTTALVLSLPKVDWHPARMAGDAGQASPAADVPLRASDRRLLWPLGLSGEQPMLLVTAGAMQGLGLLRSLAQMLREWARAGVACDLVVLNGELHSYQMPLQRELVLLREQHAADLAARPGAAATGLHVLRPDALSMAQLQTLRSLARVRLHADGQTLQHQVDIWCKKHRQHERQGVLAASLWGGASAVRVVPMPQRQAAAVPSQGRFAEGSGAFGFEVGRERRPPRPWSQVLANPSFGTLVTESGGGNTWAVNSRLNQLTAWSNDPVADPPAEWLLLQDRRTGETWSMTPSAWGAASARYQVEHRPGLSTIAHRRGALAVSVRWCVDAESAVKQVRIRLENHGSAKAHLRLLGMVEWLMGERRGDRATLQTTAWHAHPPSKAPGDGAGSLQLALLCTQTEAAAGLGGGTAFFCEGHPGADDALGLDWTCDRGAFFDAEGQLQLPQRLGQRSGYGLDPCAALSRLVTLRPGASLEQVFLLGHAASPEAARALSRQAAAVPAETRERAALAHWDALLATTQVKTPDPLLDVLVNRWLPYQTISSRLWAKAGFYQAGGATGYRDQLQDAMALVWTNPALLREQILQCAARQFRAGDVQHWWHAPGGAGVRTHFSDDRLWLPFACSHYLRATGDNDVLDLHVPFLEGAAIPEGAEDVYDTPRASPMQASLYEHAARAIDRSLPVGAHGLPLMGGGDWNDGMNRVGHAGRGESVWLAWFLCGIVTEWIPLARQRCEPGRAARWEAARRGWRKALNGAGWDGQWFRRAFFDDGSALGSAANTEARIDLIAQAWAVLSGQTSEARQRQAMAAVEQHLVDAQAGLIQLLAPPLVHAQPSAGYIQAYPPGVRENGGQYAHAGAWALMAAAMLARRDPQDRAANDTAYRYFRFLSPAHRAAHPEWGPAYGAEPYAMAADVYSQPPYVGRAGWSWYTGAAGWMHRAAVESILGLQLEAEELRFTPCLPSHWPGAELTLVRGTHSMRFVLTRADPAAELAACGEPQARLLQVGEALAWRELPPQSCFVVPLPGW